jgi:hypothetical protein
MFRTAFVIVTVLAVTRFLPCSSAAPPTELVPGEKFEGEIGGKLVNVLTSENVVVAFFLAEVPVTLKAGQGITFSVTVVGKGRQVVLNLMDPTGKVIEKSSVGKKSISLTAEEVSASGKYKLVVASDLIGPFTLRTSTQSSPKLDREAIEKRIKELKKELADLEAQLKGSSAKPIDKD